jgi:hypothetical protein
MILYRRKDVDALDYVCAALSICRSCFYQNAAEKNTKEVAAKKSKSLWFSCTIGTPYISVPQDLALIGSQSCVTCSLRVCAMF